MIATYIAIALWAFIAISLFCIVVLVYFFLRIFTALKSVAQELRWTAEAYSGRDYKQEKEVARSNDPDRVQIEKPWNDEMEAKS